MKRAVRKSLALLLAVSVFASTIDSRAYAAEVKVESTMESTAVEEVIEKESETLREESVEGVLTECETESVTVVYTEEVTIEEASVIEGETTVESATDEIETSEDGSGVAETKVTDGEEITTEDCETDMSASDETTTEVFSSEEIWTEEPLTDETLVEEDTMVENITVESTTEEVTEEDTASTEESTEESVYEADNFSVVFKLDSAWDGGYNASVRIENAGDEVIHDWHLRWNANYEIVNIWNAEIYQTEEGSCTIKNAGWNQDIAVGSYVEFGFSGSGEFSCFPTSYEIIGQTTQIGTEDYSIEYSLASDWGSGYSATISITNNTEVVLEDWVLEFDFNRDITSIWNATIEETEGNHYVIRNVGYNENIDVGQTISFGFNGEGGQKEDVPTNYQLYTYVLVDDSYADLADGKIDKEYLERAIYPNMLMRDMPIDDVRLSDDFDGDGLTLIEEYEYDSNPFVKDTDADGLTDYEEVKVYGTSPINWDTDADGMSDGTEVSSGLNPLKSDSDGNGIADGKEIVTQQVRLDSIYQYSLDAVGTMPKIEITGQGDYSRRIYAEAIEHDKVITDIDALVGTPFEFVHDDEMTFASSKLSFQISKEILEKYALSDLAVAWYNNDENALELLETTYDVENATISANVEHYSTYMVVSLTNYFFFMDWENVGNIIEAGKADVVFVVDTTGSMWGAIANVRNNINAFVAKLEENKVDIRLGLVEYRDIYADGVGSTKCYDWYTDVNAFKSKVGTLGISGGGDGPESAVDALYCAMNMDFRTGVNKYIIMVTDADYKNGIVGDGNVTMEDAIVELIENDISASVVTNAYYYSCYEDLVIETEGVLANISQNFADALEPLISLMGEEVNTGCWIRLADGSIVRLDKNPTEGDDTVDTDQDGIPDIEELKESYKVSAYNPYTKQMQEIDTWSICSNPAKADSDGDGLSDFSDLRPMKFDTVVVEENDTYMKFNTDRVWYNITCSSYDFWDNMMYIIDMSVDNYIPIEEFGVIANCYNKNKEQDFSIEELCYIGIMNNEGSKLYMHDETDVVRETVFQNITGRESKYYRHVGILNEEDWVECPKGTESGFFTGTVLSEADINFSNKIFFIQDISTVMNSLIQIGAVVISIIVITEITPVVLANLQALTYYVKTFGVLQGLDMYRYLGVQNLPNGVISWLQMDMADGDSSLDDLLPAIKDNGSTTNGIVNGKTPASRLADKLRELSNSKRPNTVAIVRTADGKYYAGYNKAGIYNSSIQEVLDDLGNENLYNRQCAEVNALSRALNSGADLKGATISIANVRKASDVSGVHGMYKAPCDVCQPLIEFLKIEDIY